MRDVKFSPKLLLPHPFCDQRERRRQIGWQIGVQGEDESAELSDMSDDEDS